MVVNQLPNPLPKAYQRNRMTDCPDCPTGQMQPPKRANGAVPNGECVWEKSQIELVEIPHGRRKRNHAQAYQTKIHASPLFVRFKRVSRVGRVWYQESGCVRLAVFLTPSRGFCVVLRTCACRYNASRCRSKRSKAPDTLCRGLALYSKRR